jgi:hypothetical protein
LRSKLTGTEGKVETQVSPEITVSSVIDIISVSDSLKMIGDCPADMLGEARAEVFIIPGDWYPIIAGDDLYPESTEFAGELTAE